MKNCVRMRPDRIIIGECRGGETLDMLQAMNTGHDGSMTTIHANNPRDAMARLEVMIAMAGYEIPVRRCSIASCHQCDRAGAVIDRRQTQSRGRQRNYRHGRETRSEMHDLFVFEQACVDADGHATGKFMACGIRPRVLDRIELCGLRLPPDTFQRRVLEI